MTVLYLLSQWILEEDEEIEQEKIKQTLDMQFQKQRQPFQSMEDQSAAAGAGILPVPKANASPVQYARNVSIVWILASVESHHATKNSKMDRNRKGCGILQ